MTDADARQPIVRVLGPDPEGAPEGASDDATLQRLALWLADVSAEIALAPADRPEGRADPASTDRSRR